MLPNIKIKPNVSTTNSIIGSRAYTFLDSYVYMKNQRYNAMYEKNKEILAIENNAISLKSASILHSAFNEQAKILDSIVLRIRNFTMRIKPDILENINLLIPSNSALTEFELAIAEVSDIPRMKYVKYDINPIKYENMASFLNLYRQEIKYFTDIKTQTVNKTNPFIRDRATQYLIDTAMQHANVSTELLEMENIRILNYSKLKSISHFFIHKTEFTSVINRDFKTFLFYLRQYSKLRDLVAEMDPIEQRDGSVLLKNASKSISFNDYFVLYKHFADMIKYMIKIISYHEQQFFNKIYALQGNIESYASIVNEVLDYKEKKESLNESTLIESSNSTNIELKSTKKVNHNDRIDEYYDILLDGNKIGKIATSYYDDIKALGVGSFEINKEFRGNGYGTIVIKKLINSNKDKDKIYCYVDSTNKGAIKLYKRIGKVFDDNKTNDQFYVEFYNKKEPLNEAVVFSGNDLYKNFDKFENGDSNILLITGLTGSGKSTLAKSLCSKYNAEYIELDLLEFILKKNVELNKAGEPYTSFYDKNKKIMDDAMENSSLSNDEITNINDKFLEYVLSWSKKQKPKKCIIEGLQIYDYYAYHKKQIPYPVIIKNTSVIKSFIRKVKREEWTGKELIKNGPLTLKYMNTSDKRIKDLKKMLNESSSNNHSSLFFISNNNMDNVTLNPRIPNNYFTKNGYEDSTTKRVCFAPSIEKALMALSMNCNNKEFYVHIPKSVCDTYKPNKSEVPDSVLTGEIWVTEPVKIICIGKIMAHSTRGRGHKFTYGNNEAELYDWTFEWIEKYNIINEAYDDGYINSDEIDAHSLINGNHAADILLNDDVETPKEYISSDVLDEEDKLQLEPDSIDGVKEENISNFEEFEGSPREVNTICTMRDSLNF